MKTILERAVSRARSRALVGSALGTVLAGTMSVFPVRASAQARSGATSRDTATRVFRLQVDGDTLYIRSLGARLDSLQNAIFELRLGSPERRVITRKIEELISSLDQLDRSSRAAAWSNEVSSRIATELSRAAARAQAGARRASVVAARAWPKGWIGINVQAPHAVEMRDDSVFIRYFSYPVVVSVEPNSPAERVGIVPTDRLLAYNGADVRDREINLTQLLQPERRITVTVRRDGESRDFQVVAAKAPPQIVPFRAPFGPDVHFDGPAVAVPRVQEWSGQRPAAGVMLFGPRLDESTAPIAGASVAEIRSDGLGQPFGVTSGILVIDVHAGPAQSSGLEGGDVIVRAAGSDVTSIAQLRRIIAAHSDERAVELDIVRHHKSRTLTLHW